MFRHRAAYHLIQLVSHPPFTTGILDGLKLTGYFLTKKVFNELSVKSPVAERQRFIDLLRQKVS